MSKNSKQITLPPAELMPTMDTAELAALRVIMEGTAQDTGEEFFRSLVRNLSIATGVANAFIAEFADIKTHVRTLAFWMNGEFIENRE